MMPRCLKLLLVSTAAAAALALIGCNGGTTTEAYTVYTGGNAEHGKQLIAGYGCGACHMIPGVQGARGLVGPPLFYLGQRTMIAGMLPNSPANLAHWIQHPRSVNPHTAMPDLGLTSDQAYDIAAYLYTLPGPKEYPWSH